MSAFKKGGDLSLTVREHEPWRCVSGYQEGILKRAWALLQAFVYDPFIE
ncbi:hypothetical protein [Muriicola jejuensis]|uniref:Uncharacterized protein n=1 Tax=Muriicola jejuensis TaxID=504488 RepID=A0A6P0UL98_9FLAO|nr:hypothetical protein [Muriicola jejuensis]NER11016.1 hypothetical protein [Muriicola jejuensis]